MEKKVYSRKILSALLAVVVVLGCLPMAMLGASAAVVDYVVSDDFTVGGKAVVDGAATDRTEVWGAYNLEQVILGNATEGTYSDGVATPVSKTVGTSSADVMAFANTPYSLYVYKDMRDTDVIKSFTVDLGMFSSPSRNHTAGVCVYYDPSTGESLSIVPISHNSYGIQCDYAHMVKSSTGATDMNDGSIKGVTKGGAFNSSDASLAFNETNYPNGLWMRATIDYVYGNTSGELESIKITFSLYKDNTYTEPVKTFTDTLSALWNGHFKNFLNKTSTAVVNQDFQVGVYMPSEAYGIDPAAVSVDSMKLNLSRELSQEDLQAKADAFKAEYATVLALNAADVTAQNATDVIAAANAIKLLNAEVQQLLTAESAKLEELVAAAAPFVPTANQTAFETYYTENGIGDMASIADPAVIEEALKLYNAIEDTHKGNVAAKYAKIAALVKAAYVKTTAAQEIITLPADTYANISAMVIGAVNADSYTASVNLKFNAYKLYNDNTSRLYVPFLTQGDAYLGLSLERGGTTANEESLQGIFVRRYMSGVADKVSKLEADPDAYAFATDAFSPNQSLNGNYTSAECVAASKALFMDSNPIITEDNPYMNFCFSMDGIEAIEAPALGGYKVLGKMKFAIYYDTNKNNTLDAGDYVIVNVGFGESTASLIVAAKSATSAMPAFGFNITSNVSGMVNEAVITTNLLNVGDLTPAEQFVADHGSVLNSAAPNADDTLAMYIAYNALATEVKAEVDTLVTTPVETVVDNAKVRPTTNGATIRTNIDQNIAFYTTKPEAATSTFRIKEMGSVICGLGYAVENGLAMEKGEEGTVYGSKTYATAAEVDAEVLTYLKGTDISGKDNWGTYIVARSFVVYTDGSTDLVLYSTNKDDKNTTNFDGEFDSTGMVIRSVNQIVKSIAAAVKFNGTPDLYAAHKGTANAFTDEYAGVSYADLTNLDANGLVLVAGVKDAEATVKMLVAYSDLIAAIVNQ